MSETRARKAELRARLLEARRKLSPDERQAAGAALMRRVRDLPHTATSGTVAAYVSTGTEPSTRGLIDTLRGSGTQVLLPVLLPDNDLDWAEYTGAADLQCAPRGLLEPVGPRLGPGAVTATSSVL